jgi:hypothetical protein
MEYTVLKLFLFNVFQTGIVCCLIRCFHGNIVLLIVFHYNHTIYSIHEYFIITNVSIIFKPTILVIGICLGADKQGPLPLTIILHKNHQIYVGTQYETCSSTHVSEMVIDPHHDRPGGFPRPAHVYLLCSPSAATRGKMGITCALSALNSAKYPKTSWVVVTLQRLAHTTPHVRIPHICLHFSAAALHETCPFQAHSLLCHRAMPTTLDFTFSPTSAWPNVALSWWLTLWWLLQ